MKFLPLDNSEQLDSIATATDYQVILKHNTTCSISEGVLDRMEASQAEIPSVEQVYILDLLNNREISNEISSRFGVEHKSPQLLLIKDGKCVYTEWGFDISIEATSAAIAERK